MIANQYLRGYPLFNSLEENESLTPEEATEFLRESLSRRGLQFLL
jgi:hypothetical protein